jgi:hypothetical protein
MDHGSPPEDDVFPRFRRCWDRRLIGRFESSLQNKNPTSSSGEVTWSLRRLVLSTVSVNAVLWAATIFVVWWAVSL